MSNKCFDELLSQARELDCGVNYLRQKLLEPSTLGYGTKALSTVKSVSDELSQIQEFCDEMIQCQKQENITMDQNKQSVLAIIEECWEYLGSLEVDRKNYDYVPFPLKEQLNLIESNDVLHDNENDDSDCKLEAEISNDESLPRTPNNGHTPDNILSKKYPMNNYFTPISSLRHIESEQEPRTPEEPIMSDITMQILGRSIKSSYRRYK